MRVLLIEFQFGKQDWLILMSIYITWTRYNASE